MFKELFRFKFVKDSLFVLVSYIVLSISGIAANVLIGNAYGAEGLGIFNQVLAIYMLLSLITVFGLNISVVKHTAEYNSDKKVLKDIFSSASHISLFLSLSITSALLCLTNYFPSFFFNNEVTKATTIALLSLPIFTQNKIFMALANGLRHMKVYALVQSCRWLLIILFIAMSILSNKSIHYLSYCFLFSETILFFFFVIIYHRFFIIKIDNNKWYKKHFAFGSKSALLGFLGEANTKIDIFLISFFLSNYHVGIYSFASTIVQGFLMLSSVVQLNINPIVSEFWAKRDTEALKKYTFRITKTMLWVMIPVLIVSAIAYPILLPVFMPAPSYLKSLPVFYILLAGILLPTVYGFTGAYLTMAGFLNVVLKNIIIKIVFNVVTCVIFISIFGFYGAAIATASTYVFSIILTYYYVKKLMQIQIIKF